MAGRKRPLSTGLPARVCYLDHLANRPTYLLNLLGGSIATFTQAMVTSPAGASVDPGVAAIGAAIGTVGAFCVNVGYTEFREGQEEGEAQRNHHLKYAVASAIRHALVESTRQQVHPRLFRAWDTMLFRATNELAWLDQLLPGRTLEESLTSANEYQRSGLAEPALRNLLRSWLEPPTPLMPEDRELYLGLASYWSAEAEEISAEILTGFQTHFTAIVGGDAKGHLRRAFEVKTLLRIDQTVSDTNRRVIKIEDKIVDADQIEAILRKVMRSELTPPDASQGPSTELPAKLVEWAEQNALTPDQVRQALEAWERDRERAAQRGEPGASAERALAAYARRELSRAATLADSEATAAENELAITEKQLEVLAEKQQHATAKRRATRRQAWESRTLQARALYEQWHFAKALQAYQGALLHIDGETAPQDWAMTHNNLGNTLQEQGIRTAGDAGAELLGQAVSAYRNALEVRTREDLPQDWAMTHNNLGNTLQEQGIRTAGDAGTKLLGQAVSAYRDALEVYTREDLPQQWAMAHNNLGNTLKEQGIRTAGDAGAELLGQAVSAYRNALEVYTMELAPHYHALVQRNLDRAVQLRDNHE